MDPLSLSALGAVGLGHAMKFLLDRAGTALDRKASRVTAAESTSEAPASEPAEVELRDIVQQLEGYRHANQDSLDPQDLVLLSKLERLHAALERFEGQTVDVRTAVRSLIEVDQNADYVHGKVTGAEVHTPEPGSSTHVRQRFGTVGEGAEITGYRGGQTR